MLRNPRYESGSFLRMILVDLYWRQEIKVFLTNVITAKSVRDITKFFQPILPARVYVLMGRTYRLFNLLEYAQNLLEAGLAKYPDCPNVLSEYAHLALAMQEYDIMDKCLQSLCEDINGSMPLASSVCSLLIARYETVGKCAPKNVVRKLSKPSALQAEKSYRYLRRGEKQEALDCFRLSLELLDLKETQEIWLDSYERIADFFQGEDSDGNGQEINETSVFDDMNNPLQKILVAGIGWSGSGALYDYFREFKSVAPILEEHQYIEGKNSLSSIENKIHDMDGFKEELLNFFSIALLANDVPTDSLDMKELTLSRYFVSRSNRTYANACNRFVRRIISHANRSKLSIESFHKESAILIDSILHSRIKGQPNYVLLDNVIHCKNVSSTNLIDDFDLFAVFRDPRSQYAAKYYEFPGYIRDVHEFIQDYKEQRNSFDVQIRTSVSQPDRVHVVQFENFILSEEYRKELTERIGLDPSTQRRHRHFNPRVSRKNVQLHHDFPFQEDIKAIEEALPEYCLNAENLQKLS
jgi:tetratricopeptide (TPR) repeat protein